MWETISMWGGVAGILVSLFAIIIIFLTRKNILDILDKDVILFDKNFELKNKAIQKALNLVDEIERNNSIIHTPDFNEKARVCYNELLCVLTDVRVADEFYNIAVDSSNESNETQIAQFKLSCRHDIGLKTKKAKIVKRTIEKPKDINEQLINYQSPSMDYNRPMSSFGGQLAQTMNTQPIKPQSVQPTPTQTKPLPKSSQPTSSIQTPVRPVGRPPRPIARPTDAQQPVRRPIRPNSEDDKI